MPTEGKPGEWPWNKESVCVLSCYIWISQFAWTFWLHSGRPDADERWSWRGGRLEDTGKKVQTEKNSLFFRMGIQHSASNNFIPSTQERKVCHLSHCSSSQSAQKVHVDSTKLILRLLRQGKAAEPRKRGCQRFLFSGYFLEKVHWFIACRWHTRNKNEYSEK